MADSYSAGVPIAHQRFETTSRSETVDGVLPQNVRYVRHASKVVGGIFRAWLRMISRISFGTVSVMGQSAWSQSCRHVAQTAFNEHVYVPLSFDGAEKVAQQWDACAVGVGELVVRLYSRLRLTQLAFWGQCWALE